MKAFWTFWRLPKKETQVSKDTTPPPAKGVIALTFRLVVEEIKFPQHSRYRTEAWLNEGLDNHLKQCKECRDTIVNDLREFADQIEREP